MLQSIATVLYCAPLVALAPLILYVYMKYKHSYWKRNGIPTAPESHWLFGHFKDVVLARKPAGPAVADLYQMANDDQDLLGIYIFHKPYLLIRSPEIVKRILIADFNVFPNHFFSGKSISDKVGSSNLLTIEYPDWKHLRTKLTPVFSSGKIKKLFSLMVETSESMKRYLDSQFINDGETKAMLPVDLNTKYTTDVISSLAFGLKTNSFTDPPPEFFIKARDAVHLDFMRTLTYFIMFFFPNFGQYLCGQMLGSATNYFRKIFWESMNAREASGLKRGDLIDSLIELKNEKQDTPFKFDGDTLLAQTAIFLFAGRDTSIGLGTYTLYELAKHPDIQRKTRKSIIEKLQEHGMTYEGVMSMKYLHEVMSEVLRLYPPAAIIDRVPIVDYKIPDTDTVIKKGTPVYISVQGLHLDSKYYPEPHEFDPHRFSDERKGMISPCTYLAYGDGPRTCIGMRLGSLQTAVALIRILENYEVTIHKKDQCVINPRSVFIAPPEDFSLNFTKISNT